MKVLLVNHSDSSWVVCRDGQLEVVAGGEHIEEGLDGGLHTHGPKLHPQHLHHHHHQRQDLLTHAWRKEGKCCLVICF